MLAALLLALAQGPAVPDACLVDGAKQVTLTGEIGIATARGDPAHGRAPYRYATLTLDHPICVRGPQSGLVPSVGVVALVAAPPNQTLPFRFKGRAAKVTGTLMRPTTLDQPPTDVLILDPQIAPAGE